MVLEQVAEHFAMVNFMKQKALKVTFGWVVVE